MLKVQARKQRDLCSFQTDSETAEDEIVEKGRVSLRKIK